MFWGCCFPCVLLAVVFNFVLSHCGFPIRGLSFCVLGLCIVAIVFTLKLGYCCCFPGLGCCGWAVLATLGPKPTLGCPLDLSCDPPLFGAVPCCLWLLHRAVKGLFGCWYAVVEPWTVLAWPIYRWPDKPSCVDFLNCAPWLCVSLQLTFSPEESCPARGWQCCWEIYEQAGLWLGGTLQRRSWLRVNSSSKDKYWQLLHLCNLYWC